MGLFKEFFCCCFRGVCGFFVAVVSFFQGKRKRKPPSAKSCLCMRWAFLGQWVHRPRRLESRCLPASHQPSLQEGVRTSLSLAKVLWLTSKLSVMEGRGGRRESQTLGKVGGEDAGEEGPGGRTGRCSCRGGRCRRGTAIRGMGDVSQVVEIRGSAAWPHAAASVPRWGTSLL